MVNLTRLAHIFIPLFLLSTTAIVAFVISRIRYLSLPISQTFATFALILPTVAAASLQGTRVFLRKSWKDDKLSLNLPILALIIIQIIYETIIATLSLTHIVPESALNCALGERWQELFVKKDELAIRAIQDNFECCGLRTVKDRAWPFKSNQPSYCFQTYGRSQSCLVPWRRSQKTNAGLIFLIVIVVFVAKVSAIIFVITKSTKLKRHSITFEGEEPQSPQRNNFGRLLIKDDNSRNAFQEDETENIRSENEGSNDVDRNTEIMPLLPEARNDWVTEGNAT
ncbi:putative tetraspanin tsp3 [Erysiphe neolycopersici]|uniref:Putative tetraspanin tsp3 n=1 Tax=Erysiphe neolycopersici TaxID=212602 RepID=A0A420HVQ7_9PEZI|nr:putative tetraspanin tsp3 [Erysiphe neolycopersici]